MRLFQSHLVPICLSVVLAILSQARQLNSHLKKSYKIILIVSEFIVSNNVRRELYIVDLNNNALSGNDRKLKHIISIFFKRAETKATRMSSINFYVKF